MGSLRDKVRGCIIGGTLGDSLGGITEMMHYETIERTFGEIDDMRPTGATNETARFDSNLPPGRFTDDTRLKHLIIEGIAERRGPMTADQFGRHMLEHLHGWYFTPVVNAYNKMSVGACRPRAAGRGNMGSNSTAMAIAPVGVINAGRPAAAAANAYDMASVIHEEYSLDAAAAVAAGVAAGMAAGSTAETVTDAAIGCIDEGADMRELIERAVALARECKDYKLFRQRFYETCLFPWPQVDLAGQNPVPEGFYDTAEPRETVPAAFGLLALVGGNVRDAVLYAANFGRDADTLGSIVGGLSGAIGGASTIPAEWIDVLDGANEVTADFYVDALTEALLAHYATERDALDTVLAAGS